MTQIRIEKKLYRGEDLVRMLFDNAMGLAGPETTRKILEALAKLPPADASDVTWCRDCKRYCPDDGWCQCFPMEHFTQPDDFCSHAERRKDG